MRSALNVIDAVARTAPPRALTAAAGIVHERLHEPQARIPIRQLVRVGASADPRTFDVMGYIITNSAEIGSRFAGGIAPREVHFRHAAPRDRDEYRRRFASTVRFDMPMNGLLFDATALRAPLVNADQRLRDLLVAYADERLGTARTGDLVDRVRLAMAVTYLRETDMSVGQIAARLGYASPSELHRAFRVWTGMTPRQFRS